MLHCRPVKSAASAPARAIRLLAIVLSVSLCGLAGCASSPAGAPAAADARSAAPDTPYPSTYRPLPSGITLIAGGMVLTGTGERLEGADVLIADGRIAAVGTDLEVPDGAGVIDASGWWVTPGVIDVHSHLGVYPSPGLASTQDGNEMTEPVTAHVWAEHSVWPQDPGFSRALAGGVTSLHVLPGSANLIGGRGVTLKNVPSRTVAGMKFPDAPYSLKMACGENPKRVYGNKGRAPSTRMGNVAGYRQAFLEAQEYREWRRSGGSAADRGASRRGNGMNGRPRSRDLGKETLVGVLEGEILVHMHCYRAEEMATVLDLAAEMGFSVTAFHHAVEAYKVADLLAEAGVCAAMWADWWGFKLEAFDGVRENIALVDRVPGGCAIVHSDSEIGIQRLNQEAAKAMAAGRRIGLDVDRAEAIRWITANPARALGIDGETGTLEAGKAADVVIWSGDPFSVYTHAERVYVDGAAVYDRSDPELQPVSDFELGILGVEE